MCQCGCNTPSSPTTAPDASTPTAATGTTCPSPIRIIIIPRSKANIFDRSQSRPVTAVVQELKDILPGYVAMGLPSYTNLRAIEGRFYVDIAVDRAGVYTGHRKLTAILVQANGSPYANQRVEWTRQAGSAELRFWDTSGNAQTALTGTNAVQTDANGMAEVTVIHPARSVAAGDARLTIRAQAGAEQAQIYLTITRNDAATQIDDIARRTSTDADHIWVYQPDSNHRTARNAGIEELQEVINEVVSRHRGINSYTWVPRNGVFADEMRDALQNYRARFVNVQRGTHYPYDLSNIGQSQNLLNYLRVEYAPFDPRAAGNTGWIIDRRLLIGDRWDTNHAQIDGLWELYEGVVQVLRNQMRAFGQSYLNCSTFWLHRPMHGPYQAATDNVFGSHHNNEVLRTTPTPTGTVLTSGGSQVTINDGDHFLVNNQSGGWVQVTSPAWTPAWTGWVRASRGAVVHNDAGRFRVTGVQVRNHGTHGIAGTGYSQRHTLNGVAYTYGGKQTPTEWMNDLNGNPHAGPNQICHYNEYRRGHRFGETRQEYNAGNRL